MKKLRLVIAMVVTLSCVTGGFAISQQVVQDEDVLTQTPSGGILRNLTDKDNPASPNRWRCQNVQTTPCYYSFNETTGEYDIPSSETGFAETY